MPFPGHIYGITPKAASVDVRNNYYAIIYATHHLNDFS